jgi:hypothetical protein
MDKFIEFNGGVFNTRHIIAMTKCKRGWDPQYGIELFVTDDIEYQWFNEEYERDTIFNQLSEELLKE